MTSRRLLKAAEAIREVVSMAILTEIRDPRVQHVTVTGVEVAPDMKSAKVIISVMGDEGRQHLCLRGLQNAAGFLQSKIADRIDTRYIPRLTFSLDTGLKKGLEVNRILADLAREREQSASNSAASESSEETPSAPSVSAAAENLVTGGSAGDNSDEPSEQHTSSAAPQRQPPSSTDANRGADPS